MKMFRKLFVVALGFLAIQSAMAEQAPRLSKKPLLLIGASYAEGKTPFSNGQAPLGGIAVGFGNYLSLGAALIQDDRLSGYVINEGQAGGGTAARPYCAPGADTCGPAGWDSYQTQLDRAMSRVALPPTFTDLNSKYVIITLSNDCLHSDAFGVPQSQAVQCSTSDMIASVDRMIAVGQSAIERGLTPIYDVLPKYSDLDLPLFRNTFGLQWVIDENDYNHYRDLYKSRVQASLPQAIVLDIWEEFTHGGDGIHPDDETTRRAAKVIAKKLRKLDKQ